VVVNERYHAVFSDEVHVLFWRRARVKLSKTGKSSFILAEKEIHEPNQRDALRSEVVPPIKNYG
jgi:hypothetical protein